MNIIKVKHKLSSQLQKVKVLFESYAARLISIQKILKGKEKYILRFLIFETSDFHNQLLHYSLEYNAQMKDAIVDARENVEKIGEIRHLLQCYEKSPYNENRVIFHWYKHNLKIVKTLE